MQKLSAAEAPEASATVATNASRPGTRSSPKRGNKKQKTATKAAAAAAENSGTLAHDKDSDASDKSSEESDSENPTGKVKNIFRMKKPDNTRYTLEESFVSSLNSWPICFFNLPMLTIFLPLFFP